MSAAWTTFAVVALLLPGVAFLIGFHSRERYSREIVKSTAVGEVGMAIFLAIAIHLIAWFGLYLLLGFDLASYIKQIADYHNMASSNVADVGVHMARDGLVYLAATTTAGFLLG